MPALATWSPQDGVLGAVAPLGLAASAGTALVIDVDPQGPRYPVGTTVAELVERGPTRSELSPDRPGVALLRIGDVTIEDASEVLAALVGGWPRVVFRLPSSRPEMSPLAAPLVPVRPLLSWFPWNGRPAVYQDLGRSTPLPGPGVRLPRPRNATWRALMAGRIPARDRWVSAWREVWSAPW